MPALAVAGDEDSVGKPEASDRIDQETPREPLTFLAPAKDIGLIEHHNRFAQIVGKCAPGVSHHLAEPAL